MAPGGFSIIELLVVTAVVAVLTSAGLLLLPRDRIQAREAARVVAADLNRARSEALRLNAAVAFERSGDDYRIFADPDRNGTPDGNLDNDPDGTAELAEPVLQVRDLGDTYPAITIGGSFNGVQRIWFDVRGLPRTGSGAFLGQASRLTFRTPKGHGYDVLLEPQGRIQVVRP